MGLILPSFAVKRRSNAGSAEGSSLAYAHTHTHTHKSKDYDNIILLLLLLLEGTALFRPQNIDYSISPLVSQKSKFQVRVVCDSTLSSKDDLLALVAGGLFSFPYAISLF